MRWIMPKRKDEEISASPDFQPVERFNIPLPENDGSICVAEPPCKTVTWTECGNADEDISCGRVKKFDNPDDMIAGLKRPW